MRFFALALALLLVPTTALAESFVPDSSWIDVGPEPDAGVDPGMDAIVDEDAAADDAAEDMDAGVEEPDAPPPVGMDAGERVDAPGPPPGSGVRCSAAAGHGRGSLAGSGLLGPGLVAVGLALLARRRR